MLRNKMLALNAQEWNLAPSEEFPHVLWIMMELPMGGITASVFASRDGDASLYTTSTFGVIGAGQHNSVRLPALEWVKMAENYVDLMAPTNELGYAPSTFVRFYILTQEGLRKADVGVMGIMSSSNDFNQLYGMGQIVLTEIRKASGG